MHETNSFYCASLFSMLGFGETENVHIWTSDDLRHYKGANWKIRKYGDFFGGSASLFLLEFEDL